MKHLLIFILNIYRKQLVRRLCADKELIVLLKGFDAPEIVKDIKTGVKRLSSIDKVIADIKDFYV